MKINSLILENITSYAGMKADFPQKISVVLGHNAAGKTTLLDAITYALTKACDRTDKAGRGAENMIRTGAKDGLIMMEVSSNGAEPIKLARPIQGELAIEGQHGGKTQLQANLCEYLGVDVGALSAALSTTAFIDMKPSEQKGLLFGLLELSFEKDNIINQVALEMKLGEEQKQAAERMMNAAPANLFTGEASTFDKLHGHFYTLRRDYKRDLKALGEPEQPKLIEEPPTAEIVELLEDLRKQRSELQKQEAANAATLKMVARLAEEIKYLEDRLPDAGDPETARAEIGEVQDAINEVQVKLGAANAKAAACSSTAFKLEGGKQCPMGSDDAPVECSMTKQKREKLIAGLRADAKASDEEATGFIHEMDNIQISIDALSREAEKPSRTDIEAQIEQKRAELKELPNPVPVGPTTAAEIATLTDRISEGERVLASANREEGARAERDKQQKKRASLEETVEVLEALVDVLSPSGLPGKILSQTIGPIEARANARLQELTGGRYSLHLVLDDFAVIVDHDGITTDLKRLSSSERFRIGLVLQDAIIHLTGLRFMVIDNADVLDAENRELLMDFIMAIQDDYEQVLVMSTIGPAGAHRPDPPIPGLAIYLLEDGQLREVG